MESVKYWRTSSAAPAAEGVAIEVPVFSTVPQEAPLFPLDCADMRASPGATRSGLMRPSYTGPLEL